MGLAEADGEEVVTVAVESADALVRGMVGEGGVGVALVLGVGCSMLLVWSSVTD